MGTVKDTRRRKALRDIVKEQKSVEKARKLIFCGGVKLSSLKVQRVLATGSLLPVRNAFSRIENFDIHKIIVTDILHEFEIGVWKSIFSHLMRILVAQGGNAITDLNARYRQIPTFKSIRKFSNNASAMKKLAARDFEDLLQCAYPVFQGLLPEPHNKTVLKLLFVLASWHAYAKLRIHTDTTLGFLKEATVSLGRVVRRFRRTTCEAYETKELPKETAARGRRKAAMTAKKSEQSGSKPAATENPATEKSVAARKKQLNINTIKFHSLAKVAENIERFGTTDSYNTQIVSPF